MIDGIAPVPLGIPLLITSFPSIVGELPTLTEFPIGHPLTSIFKGVEDYTQTEFVKLDRSQSLLSRRVEYSFWFALSMAMYDDEVFWAEIKESVCKHTASVMSRPGEPRHADYHALVAYAALRRAPFGALRDQLEPDSRIVGSPYTVEPPGPEIWQFVADTLKIELLVIIAHIPAARNRRARYKTVVPRGEHNSRQVLLLLEEDGEYRAVRPRVDHPLSWHFEKHMPPHYSGPITRANQLRRSAVIEMSNLRRPPLVEIDEWGIPTHLDRPCCCPSEYSRVGRAAACPP